MKKIVFFLQNLINGGVQKSVVTLANYLIDFYDVSIILAENNTVINYKINKKIKIYLIETKKFDLTKNNVGMEIFNYRVNALEELLAKVEVDLVFSYEDYNNLILLSTKALCKKAISCRNCIEEKFTLLGHIHLLDNKFYIQKIKELYYKADLIVTVSKAIQNELSKFTYSKNIHTIYNGISQDIPYIKPTIHNGYILNVARLVEQKGQKDLIKAFKMLEKQITQNLIIVGEGKNKKELEMLINHLNLKNRVYLVGFDNPYKYIQKCDLFVFSSYYEGFSNSILEVMACKKNIVSYQYDGSEEILFDDNLCTLKNIKELSKKILFYLTNKDKNEILAKKLYEKTKKFTIKNTLCNYKKEIDKLCAV